MVCCVIVSVKRSLNCIRVVIRLVLLRFSHTPGERYPPLERHEKLVLLVVSDTNTRSSSDTLYQPFTPPNKDLLAFTRCFAFNPLWPRQTFYVYSKAVSSVRSIITIDQAESLEAFSCRWLE